MSQLSQQNSQQASKVNPFDEIIQFYRTLQVEDRVQREKAKDGLGKTIYCNPELSSGQKDFFAQLLPMISERTLHEFSEGVIQESMDKLLKTILTKG